MGKKKGNIKTLGQEVKKEEALEKKSTGERTEEVNTQEVEKYPGKAVSGLIEDVSALLTHKGFNHDGNDTHPLAIAKKTLQRCIDRLKTIK